MHSTHDCVTPPLCYNHDLMHSWLWLWCHCITLSSSLPSSGAQQLHWSGQQGRACSLLLDVWRRLPGHHYQSAAQVCTHTCTHAHAHPHTHIHTHTHTHTQYMHTHTWIHAYTTHTCTHMDMYTTSYPTLGLIYHLPTLSHFLLTHTPTLLTPHLHLLFSQNAEGDGIQGFRSITSSRTNGAGRLHQGELYSLVNDYITITSQTVPLV